MAGSFFKDDDRMVFRQSINDRSSKPDSHDDHIFDEPKRGPFLGWQDVIADFEKPEPKSSTYHQSAQAKGNDK